MGGKFFRYITQSFFFALAMAVGTFVGVLMFFPWYEIESKIEESGDIDISHITLAFPVGLKFGDVLIKDINASFDTIVIKPSVISFLSGKPSLSAVALAEKTRIFVKLSADGYIGAKGFGKLEDFLRESSGAFSFEVELNGLGEGKADSIDGFLKIKGEKLKLFIPPTGGVIPIEGKVKVDFFEGDIVVKNGLATLKKFRASGDVSFDLKGTVRLRFPLQRSLLDLQGKVQAKFFPIPAENIKIRGTLENPRVVW